jgi:hypothetical protein
MPKRGFQFNEWMEEEKAGDSAWDARLGRIFCLASISEEELLGSPDWAETAVCPVES